MHKTLQILELAEMILSYVPRPSLPAVACTCRFFSKLASSLIWRTANWKALTHIIHFYTDQIDNAQKNRFHHYVSSVTTFRMKGALFSVNDSTAATFQAHLVTVKSIEPTLPIFPRLQVLYYSTRHSQYLATATLLFGPKLREIIVRVPLDIVKIEEKKEWNSSWSGLLLALPEKCPDLRSSMLMINCKSLLVESLVNFLRKIKQVRCFGGKKMLCPEVMDALACLPSLVVLVVESHIRTKIMLSNLSKDIDNPFARLRRLNVQTIVIESASRLLMILPPKMVFLTLGCYLLDEDGGNEDDDFDVQISRRPSESDANLFNP